MDLVDPCVACIRASREPFTSKVVKENGVTIRIFARPETTIVWSDVRIGGKRLRAPTGTPDPVEAEALVREWARRLSLGCAP